ncbi:MAG: hypothetical protein ACHP84_11350 [Caulobacterales bacterium]
MSRGRHIEPLRRTAFAAAAIALLSAAPVWADPAPPEVSNSFDTSANGTEGILGVNQNAGDNNNQGNAVSIAVTSGDNSAALARVIASEKQKSLVGVVTQTTQANGITNSFNGFEGIAQVNQTTGESNIQLNIVAIAFAAGATFSPALTDVELKTVSVPTVGAGPMSAADCPAAGCNTVSGSFNSFSGIAQVQQIVGDANTVNNVVAIAMGVGG